jgi:RNA polymerase sigma-70 factor, ECF subfamily
VSEPERELVRRAAHGDGAAFDRLVRSCQPRLVRYLRFLAADPAVADDLTQETLIRLHAHLGEFRGESDFMTWLLRIARNVTYDAQRSERRRRNRERSAMVERQPSEPAAVREVAAAIESLPLQLREALLLVEIWGFAYAEAGEVLGVPEGTVKSRVHRARQGVSRWYAASEAGTG